MTVVELGAVRRVKILICYYLSRQTRLLLPIGYPEGQISCVHVLFLVVRIGNAQHIGMLLLHTEGGLSTLDDLVFLLGIELSQLAGANIVDQSVHLKISFGNSINDHRVLKQDFDTASDVQFDQLESPLLLIEALKELKVLPPQCSERHQPCVDQTKTLVIEGCCNTTATSMSTDDDVLDLEVLNSVLDDRQGVDIGWYKNIGDVAVAENLTGLETQDGGLGASRVCTSNP